MSLKQIVSNCLHGLRVAFVALTVFQFSLGGPLAGSLQAQENTHTRSPIKHLIVLIGENRTFDHVFATYVPKSHDSVKNLLSEGIINADGTPGKHFSKAAQFQAVAPFKTKFFISLDKDEKAPYQTLPSPSLNFAPTATIFPPGTPLNFLEAIEPSQEAADENLLTTGAASQFPQTFVQPDPDTRVQNFNALPNGPFPLKGKNLPYDSFTGDTTHRLFEMWQQSDCNIKNATRHNPSGCLSDLYPFVITNYTNQIDGIFNNPPAFDDNGGGNSIFWSDGNGTPTTPPSHIANPDPLPGTDDVYTVDLLFDGNFTECGDPTQPGIAPIRDYLASLPYNPDPKCQAGHFYMINNDSPRFLPDGTIDTAGIAKGGSIPPVNTRTIGEALNEKNISWAYYGGAYNAAIAFQHNPQSKDPLVLIGQAYCNICNFEPYATAIMDDSTQRAAHIKDATDFFAAIDSETLPAVSFVKPDGLIDGHPASSKLDLFEGMVKKTVDHLMARPDLFASTALIVTFDEGGGYYDSGYIQPLDFFGDGPRIPLID